MLRAVFCEDRCNKLLKSMESSRGDHLGSPDATLSANGARVVAERENAQRVGLELLEV